MRFESSILVAAWLLLSPDASCQQQKEIDTPKDESEVSDVLKKTVIPIVDWPEQDIVERLLVIRHEAAKVGITVEWSKDVANSERRWKPLGVRNIPFLEAIKFMVSGTVLRCEIRKPNVLYFLFHSEIPNPLPNPKLPVHSDHPDPFDPEHHDPLTPK